MLRIRAEQVTVSDAHGVLLPPTSLSVGAGELALVHGDPGTGSTALALALTGRMRPGTGSVAVAGVPEHADRPELRDIAAVVDAPGVSEPDGALTLGTVIGEELALAGGPARKHDVRRLLTERELAGSASTRFERLGAEPRTRLLTELAASRPGVRMLVLDRPDRHTAEVTGWYEVARAQAERGLAVVVLLATASPAVLPASPALIGAHEQPDPQVFGSDPETGAQNIEEQQA